MANWITDIQSKSRGFRPGMEIQMITAGSKNGKSVWVDIESDEFHPFRETFRPHYAEYRDHKTGETFWKKYNKMPPNVMFAYNVVRHNEDGTYQYIKNRKDGNLRHLTEDEIMWVLLHV